MYTPGHFQAADVSEMHAFIEQHSFATLAALGPQGLEATHVPLLLEHGLGRFGRLAGHLARANPLAELAAGSSVLAIFAGPHAYVSPGWYETPQAVPTWNYTAVHASGAITIVDDAEWLRGHLRRMVAAYEAPRPRPWSLELAGAEYFERMLQGIVGFQIEIAQLQGKWKLSQNHPRQRQERIIEGLRETGAPMDRQVADLMAARLD